MTGVKRQPRVRSTVAFRLSVEAQHPDIAFRKAQDEVLPLYLAPLSAVADTPIYGSVLAIHERGLGERWLPRQSTSEVIVIPKPRNLTTAEVEEIPSLAWSARHDATARLAAMELHAANSYLMCRTDDLSDTQAILSTYYFVLERIAKRLDKDQPKSVEIGELEQRIRSLVTSLQAAESVDKKAAEINRASRDINAFRGRGMRQGIRAAGEAMGLGSECIKEAVQFTDLRNKKLGHPIPLGDHSQELGEWLPRAQTCARAYLTGYLRWVDRRGIADPAL